MAAWSSARFRFAPQARPPPPTARGEIESHDDIEVLADPANVSLRSWLWTNRASRARVEPGFPSPRPRPCRDRACEDPRLPAPGGGQRPHDSPPGLSPGSTCDARLRNARFPLRISKPLHSPLILNRRGSCTRRQVCILQWAPGHRFVETCLKSGDSPGDEVFSPPCNNPTTAPGHERQGIARRR